MKTFQAEQFVMRYLEASGCKILEKGDGYVTVKLSPEADKDLMNRSYYWSFVERTGAEPETMTFTFVFDPDKHPDLKRRPAGTPSFPMAGAAPVASVHATPGQTTPTPPAGLIAGNGPSALGQPGAGQMTNGAASPGLNGSAQLPAGQGPPGSSPAQQTENGATGQGQDSILGRYFGVVVPPPLTNRIPSDICNFGSRRLEQIFNVTRTRGKCVRLFEEPDRRPNPYVSIGYSTWLHVNYKVEYVCDMKRDEIHSLGFHMGTGQIVPRFYDQIRTRKLSPQLPSNIHLQPVVYSLDAAVEQLEAYLKTVIQNQDHSWANEAYRRLSEEFDRIDAYYEELLRTAEPDKKAEIETQYKKREQEIDWQYRPRIQVSVINCGFFHLPEGLQSPIDVVR